VNLQSDSEGVTGVITFREEEDNGALMKAREIAEFVICSLILSTNIGLSLEDIWINGKVGDPRQDNTREVFDFARVMDNATVQAIMEKGGLDTSAKYLAEFRKLSDREREYATRVLKWYSKGAMENDPVDQFIDWYLSLEILGEYGYPTCSPTQRVRKIVAGLKGTIKIDGKRLTEFRGALFHSGRREDEAREYCSGLGAIILNGVREMM
jgi:hypothetical protein